MLLFYSILLFYVIIVFLIENIGSMKNTPNTINTIVVVSVIETQLPLPPQTTALTTHAMSVSGMGTSNFGSCI